MGAIAETVASGPAEQKTKVLLVAPPASSEIARHVLSLARGLDRDQFELSLACPRRGSVAEEAASLGIEVFHVAVPPAPSPVKSMSAALGLSRLISSGGFHLVHAHSFSASLVASLAREFATWPILVTSVHEALPGGGRAGVRRWVLRMIARKSDRIVTACDTLQALFADTRGADEKLLTIPDGVDLERAADPAVRAQVRAALGVGKDTPVVGVLGDAQDIREVEFQRVMERVEARYPQAAFVSAADQRLRKPSRADTEDSGVDGPASAAALAEVFDVAVMLPPCDRFPVEAVEAMAAAKPVCGYAVGALPEVVADGVTGLLAPEGDEDALADAIEALIKDPARARAMGDAGRERARERFSLPAMIERTENCYADLARIHLVGSDKS